MSEQEKIIYEKIGQFRRKYYINLVLKGIIISLTALLSYFLIVNALEYSFRFGTALRAFLLITLVLGAIGAMTHFVFTPLYKLLNSKIGIDNEQAARKIGDFFPEISDKLLNLIQLSSSQETNELANAGISQKSEQLSQYQFDQAVEIKSNRKYLRYLAIPTALIILVLIISPSFITNSTTRIVKFNEDFREKAPFSFVMDNELSQAFRNENVDITVRLEGLAIPENVYLEDKKRRLKLNKISSGVFSYTFKKIQQSKTFNFEAAGFKSSTHKLEVVDRPNLKNFNVYLQYPKYLGRKDERRENVGNLQIPEGTNVKWQLNTLSANEMDIKFESEQEPISVQPSDNQLFNFEKRVLNSDKYTIHLKNQYSNNKQPIVYKLDVMKDEFPQIQLNTYSDTTLFKFIALSGNIVDDHGLDRLALFYKIKNVNTDYKRINIPIDRKQNNQRYYYQWALDSVGLDKGQNIEYFLGVWDNDRINGSKMTKTGLFSFKVPTKSEIEEEISKETVKTQENIDKTLDEAKELQSKIKEAENRLKGKKQLNWQDEKMLKDIIQKREELNKAIEQLKEQNQNRNEKKENFSKTDEKIKEKVEKLQDLMDELLDEETKKLYEELQKLLEEQKDVDDIQDMLNQIDNKENNLEKELERTLELFKRMKFEQELNDNINELNEQIEKQEQLEEQTDDKSVDKEDLAKEQEELQKDFEELKDKMDKMKESNQELEQPEALPDTEEEEKNIEEEQQNSKEQLEQNKRKKSKQSQQNAQDQMKQMAQKLQQMQSSSEMSMSQENLDDLRDIVHNLLKLSFDQESLMNEFSGVKQSDPRFVELAQKQLKLRDDAKIVEDSLLALSKRVFQIASFVTREVGAMNDHMDKSSMAIKERKRPIATSEQQFAMTSMNNLALLLDDVLQQMQAAMADAMGNPKPGKGKQKAPSLGELQQQLNQKIEGLKKGGKSGRQLSEELAKLAAEQERLRKALQQMQEKFGEGDNGKMPGDGLVEKMEDTEIDLVNKQITEETIKRQREILTRLLEAEDALRERDKDEERKGETAKDYENQVPKAFEEYFKLKEQEIELLKTIPPKLYPYYKKEVNEYFKRIGEQPNK